MVIPTIKVGDQAKFYSFGGFLKVEIVTIVERHNKFMVRLIEVLDKGVMNEEILAGCKKLVESGETFPIHRLQLDFGK